MAPRTLGDKELQLRAFRAARVSGRPTPKAAALDKALRTIKSATNPTTAQKAKPKRKSRRTS